ncbi:hypothetical protein [Aquidulcibacter sp.]|uniref:hypothetical protein n=1 Tax=Aquidulcibacter sp. TaxID=2052990 RepID=UPI0025C60800|nr:hypothetical protein [Aquidulcibacter sp.]MCA3693786.1 hypothetical protein [Aquidulcibacter sp.]
MKRIIGVSALAISVCVPVWAVQASGFEPPAEGATPTAVRSEPSPAAPSPVPAADAAPPQTTLPPEAIAAPPPVPVEVPAFDMAATAARFNALVGEADRLTTLRTLTPEAVQGALMSTARLSSSGISEGAASYAVLSASAHAPFASSLQTAVNLLGRDAVLERLKSDPEAFLGLVASSNEAATIASGVMADSLAKMDKATQVLGDAAYSVQKEAWAQREMDPQLVLAAHRTASTSPADISPLAASDMRNTRAEIPLDKRFLVAAAYHILGDDVTSTKLIAKPAGKMCMNRVQLNVRQCLAASRYPYEHLFCLARHSFQESSGCVRDTIK